MSSDPGVRVNALAPGLVRTDFARALWENAGDAVARRLPLRRLGEPEDIAKAGTLLGVRRRFVDHRSRARDRRWSDGGRNRRGLAVGLGISPVVG